MVCQSLGTSLPDLLAVCVHVCVWSCSFPASNTYVLMSFFSSPVNLVFLDLLYLKCAPLSLGLRFLLKTTSMPLPWYSSSMPKIHLLGLFIFMCPSVCPCCSFLFSFLNFLTSFPLPYLPVLIPLWTFLLVVRLLTTEVFIWSFLFPTSFHFSFTILSLYWIQFLYRELASYFIPFLLLLLFELFDHSYNHSVEWFITIWLVTFSRHVLLVFHVPFISALGVVWIWSSLLGRCFSFSWNHRSFSLVVHSIQERWDFYWELQVLSLVFWICHYLSEQTPYPRVKACLFLILTSAVFWCVSLNLVVLSGLTECAGPTYIIVWLYKGHPSVLTCSAFLTCVFQLRVHKQKVNSINQWTFLYRTYRLFLYQCNQQLSFSQGLNCLKIRLYI